MKKVLGLIGLMIMIQTIVFAQVSGNELHNAINKSDGLVAFYPFNGNANDESGNGNNPTYIGSGVTLTTDRFGNADNAYYFDGDSGSYIRIPADSFPTTDRTISFWFYADQIENHPTPFSYGGDVCHNSVLMMINKGDIPNAYTVLSHCASNYISAPYSGVPINKWYCFTMTISGVTQKIFINGELQQTANTFNTPTFVIGKSAIFGAILYTDGNTVYVEPTAGEFQGKLDDFRFYNIAMTDLEVQNLYNSEANGVEDEQQIPTKFALMQSYPNPFNPNTVISYQLPVANQTTLKVYDVLSNEVATLVNGYKEAGSYKVEFNPSTINHSTSSGVYFYQLKAGNFIQSKKMLLIK